MFNIIQFLRDYHIPFVTEGNKHAREGWVQVHCPFCVGSQNYHLGINIAQGYGHCWRCRGKSLWVIVKGLSRARNDEVGKILHQYSDGRPIPQQKVDIKVDIRKNTRLPYGSTDMTIRHKQYLLNRNFDPDKLKLDWGLLGTGPIGDYKHRIIIPIYYHRKLVSYQGRDITEKSDLRYKACSMDSEVIHHKHILYGLDSVKGDSAIVVEGVADVWRLGPGAIATFGTGFTLQQVQMLRRFRRIFLVFDPEPAAQQVAEELGWNLQMLGTEVQIVELDGIDPGDMKQEDADHLRRLFNFD